MRGEPCAPGWRLAALLLGAGWVVALAVACGGGDEITTVGTVGRVQGVGARPGAALGTQAGADAAAAQMLPNSTAAAPVVTAMAMAQPCADAPPPAVQAHELSDDALQLAPVPPGANPGNVPSWADPLAKP